MLNNISRRIIMNAKSFKVLSVFTLGMLLTGLFFTSAFGFGLKNLTGGDKKGTVSVDALVDTQANLCKRLNAALIDVTTAQRHFFLALDKKKEADRCKALSDNLAKGNFEDTDALAKNIDETENNAVAIKELLENSGKLDADKKRELQKGLVPYAKGTAHSVLLGKEFVAQLDSTKDAVKQAGITGALSVKKKLGTTIKVAPKVPTLGKNLLDTANIALKTAKKAKLKTDVAYAALKMEMD
jgi:hypothetical protein